MQEGVSNENMKSIQAVIKQLGNSCNGYPRLNDRSYFCIALICPELKAVAGAGIQGAGEMCGC
jgi:hypothetical protein